MLKTLIIVRLRALYSSFFRSSRIRKNRGTAFKVLVGIFALYIIANFFIMFGGLFFSMCRPMVSSGFAWLYFSFAALISITLCFVGSVFLTKAQLFDAQDNELLMSMPIPPGYILSSRIIMLLVLNYACELFVLLPAGIIYCINYGVTFTGVVFYIIGFLFLPFIPLTLSCIFGWLLAVISERVRNRSLFTTVFSLVFFVLYFYFVSQMNSYLQVIIENISLIGAKIKSFVFPVYHFGLAISEKNILSLVFFLLCAIVPFAVVYIILSNNIIKTVTAKKGFKRIRYREKPLKVGSAKTALLKKELKRFSSTPMYILNGSLGILFTLAFAVGIIIYRDLPNLYIKNMPQLSSYMNPLLTTVICFLASTNIISAPSISLEGKSIWIVQSFPVDGGDVLLAKAKMHMVVCLPSVLLASLSCVLMYKASPVQILLTFLLPVLVTVFCALFGVVVNLHFPKFDWINETIAIKQGLSTVIAMFASMAVIFIPGLLYLLLFARLMSPELYMFAFAIILGALCIWMRRYLKTKGSAIFAYLG
ncbi:MAG: hypothetical protein GXZ01_07850 [Clostridiaceae bacterium]|nr:hypothetical protein [Clostridiaceae bacterium]